MTAKEMDRIMAMFQRNRFGRGWATFAMPGKTFKGTVIGPLREAVLALLPENPHVRYFESHHRGCDRRTVRQY